MDQAAAVMVTLGNVTGKLSPTILQKATFPKKPLPSIIGNL